MTAPSIAKISRRTPVVVVLLALVLGSLGLAGTAYGADLTAKQVKKIAAKVIKKQAPKLSVAHAATAGSATTAASATTAGTAATAGNATNLGGLAATTYLDRAIGSSSTTTTDIDAGVVTQVLNPNSITVPAGVGFVRVDAVVALSPVGNTGVSMWIQRNGPCIDTGGDFDNRQFGHTSSQDSISLSRLIPVSAGDHTFRMCVVGGVNTSVDNRSMVVQTVALAG
jgi:hypothetical protein